VGGFLDFMIGKIGNINKKEGLEIYVFSEETKVGYIILNNFELSLEIHNENLKILESVDNPIFTYNNSIFLRNFNVLENYRGKGYGKFLFNYVIEESKKYKVDYLFLICKIENTIAKNLYEKFGFIKYASSNTDDLLYKKIPQD